MKVLWLKERDSLLQYDQIRPIVRSWFPSLLVAQIFGDFGLFFKDTSFK